jgi:hypothetical protein
LKWILCIGLIHNVNATLHLKVILLVKISTYQKLNMMNTFKKPRLGYEIYQMVQMIQMVQMVQIM